MPAPAHCPYCGQRLSRQGALRQYRQCPACAGPIRPVRSWDMAGNGILGCAVALFIILGLVFLVIGFYLLGGAVILGGLALVLGTGLLLWPYITPYEAAPPGPPLCANCGYDLRATPDRCPECGTPVPPRSLRVK